MLGSHFDELEWLNSYFARSDDHIDEGEIKSVLYFSLMWNMFETLACQRFATVSVIEDKVNDLYCDGLLKMEDFAPYLNHFTRRYLAGAHFNEKFDGLRFRGNDKAELVKAVLKGDIHDISNIVLALLLIVWRLRNNLFHGEKNIYRLNYQADNFKVANQLLATFLNLLKRS